MTVYQTIKLNKIVKIVQANKIRQLYMYTAVLRKVGGKKDKSARDNLER